MNRWSVGIDTGGTFTDLAAVNHDTGATFIAKVPSTPKNPDEAILSALQTFAAATKSSLAELAMFGHGTTVATNALLEGRGAYAALLITAGFRAAYMARAGTRPRGADLIDPFYRKAPPLIPLSRTYEAPERIGYDGGVMRPLDEAAIREIAETLKQQNYESIAICFLFSFLNDAHERLAARIIRETCPYIRISLSCDVLPVIREAPRISTVALDAYVGPIVGAYFDALGERTSALGIDVDRLFIMQSNGGLMRLNLAASYPNETLLSGPAAGIAFATELARTCCYPDLITFDMGGTSTDTCLIRDCQASVINGGMIGAQEIGTSMVEIRTIGAGGGAIASIGDDGLLKVGPRSAGARPGPACYALGGTEPTVTDANAMLGYVDATKFLAGKLRGDAGLAEAALLDLGKKIGIDALAAANGVRRVVNSNMASALRLNIGDKGCDPRDFALLAFGGCGPLHAADVAEEIGISTVIVPAHPGVACAMGLLMTDVKHAYAKSVPQKLSAAAARPVNEVFAALDERARKDAVREGFERSRPKLLHQLDIRYSQQGYQLTIDAPDLLDENGLMQVRQAFDRLHEATYGTCAPNEEAEIVTLRVVSTIPMPRLSLSRSPSEDDGEKASPTEHRKAYYTSAQAFIDTPVFQRTALRPGMKLSGPAIIEQLDSTTLIGPKHRLEVDASGNLVISI
jgi:N-methylhydantoinase A